MAPAHIATPAEIGGSADPDEIIVMHVSGPYAGMALINKSNDATLAAAAAAHEIIVEGTLPSGGTQPPADPTPTITTIAPATAALATLKPGPTGFTITGTGFVDGTTAVTIKGVAVSSITVNSPTEIAFDADLSGETAAGNVPIVVFNGAKSATKNFVITA